MKKITFISILFFIGLLHAVIITVDNNPYSTGNYSNLIDSHNAANSGDTIYVYPSITPYEAISVSKELTFYGVGYELDENPGYQAYPLTSIISGTMEFAIGSEFSKIIGFDGDFNIYIFTHDITINRNRLDYIKLQSDNIYNIFIYHNKIIAGNVSIRSNGDDVTAIYIFNNILISPTINSDAIFFYGNRNYFHIINNVLDAYSDVLYTNPTHSNSIIFINNIIIDGNFNYNNFINSSFQYNMSNEDQLPDGNGNIENIDMNTVFIDYNNCNFHLLLNSPAIGTGENGVDMGIYGGDAPYVDGGIPGLPSIFEIISDYIGSQQSGLDVIIKAKSNKE